MAMAADRSCRDVPVGASAPISSTASSVPGSPRATLPLVPFLPVAATSSGSWSTSRVLLYACLDFLISESRASLLLDRHLTASNLMFSGTPSIFLMSDS